MRNKKGQFIKGNIPSVLAIQKNKIRFTGRNNPKYNGGKISINCIECEKQFLIYPYRLGIVKTCSYKCAGKYQSKIRLGENSANFKGGITPECRKIRASNNMKEWRKQIFQRDDYRCFDCGAKSGEIGRTLILHADHIYQFSKYSRLRFILENGQTLCKECHKNKTIFERVGKVELNFV